MSVYEPANLHLGGVPIQGLNRFFVGTSGVGMMTGAMNGTRNFMQGAWDDDPNKFKQLGNDAGDVAAEGAAVMGGLAFMGSHARSIGAMEGAHIAGGETYRRVAKGGWEALSGNHSIPAGKMKDLMSNKEAFKVNVKGGQAYKGGMKSVFGTYKPMGWKGNVGIMAAQMAIGIGAKMALGFAGKVLDEAYSESKHFRKPHYDQRFFNTQREDQSSYQQLGQAMDSYENKMMSVARIYHAR
jgi:hypothetical protein